MSDRVTLIDPRRLPHIDVAGSKNAVPSSLLNAVTHEMIHVGTGIRGRSIASEMRVVGITNRVINAAGEATVRTTTMGWMNPSRTGGPYPRLQEFLPK